ncbi:MAG: hypothetical protein AB7S38_39945 [Vulcanimicrobiota bacterium]
MGNYVAKAPPKAPPKARPPQARPPAKVAAPPATRGAKDGSKLNPPAQRNETPSPGAAGLAATMTSNFAAPNPTSNSPGQASVDLARQFEGMNSADVKGKLPNFEAAGGNTNNCADFVSSVLQATGRLDGHEINVDDFRERLQEEGWRQIPRDEAQPGDVWITKPDQGRHTELVTEAGGGRTIGSNNVRPGFQQITEREKEADTGYYYTDRPAN